MAEEGTAEEGIAEAGAVVEALLRRHGRTYARELKIDLARNRPQPLFRWLCAALLLSARISSALAMKAAAALAEEGWTTAAKLAASSWEERVRVLNHAGYARYDESTARMLGETAERLIADYGGDLRRLRERAAGDPRALRRLLKEFKGIGDVGVDIFFREVQAAWPEIFPFADRRALAAAAGLSLPSSAEGLAELVPPADYPRLVAALVRCDLAHDRAAVLAEARG